MAKLKRMMQSLPLGQVELGGRFWGPRLETNRTTTIPHSYEQLRKTGHLKAIRGVGAKGKRPPVHHFWDSDVAKWLEAACYALTAGDDADLARKVDRVVGSIARAQEKSGYFNSYYQIIAPRARWTNLRDMHELYCAGHLMEAAVAHHEATGKTTLLDVMSRYADYIGETFRPGSRLGRGYPGHEEIELALVKLYRATGRERYLSLAKQFVDQRGQDPNYFTAEARARGEQPRSDHTNIQAHLPVREQPDAVGHAVRAGYLYAGMADVAAETGDAGLMKACRRQWRSITERRMYVHGGVGSTNHGEQFTFDYDLPNEEAYAETCAAIALVFFAHRMLEIEGDSRYADVIERCLYNGIISGVSHDGKRFFYDNYLANQPGWHDYWRRKSPERSLWFGCACCPTNVVRLFASLGRYVYSSGKDALWVHLYAEGAAECEVGGASVRLDVKTAYPWKETVAMTVRPKSPGTFTLALRLPGWCRRPAIKVNGRRVALAKITKRGYAHIRREWKRGDRVELTLPMPVELIEAHPAVRHDAGKLAIQRGPVLYCLEEADNGAALSDITISRRSRFAVKQDRKLFGGLPVIIGPAMRRSLADWRGKLYRADASQSKPVTIRAIPYHLWANRGPGEMIVWVNS